MSEEVTESGPKRWQKHGKAGDKETSEEVVEVVQVEMRAWTAYSHLIGPVCLHFSLPTASITWNVLFNPVLLEL